MVKQQQSPNFKSTKWAYRERPRSRQENPESQTEPDQNSLGEQAAPATSSWVRNWVEAGRWFPSFPSATLDLFPGAYAI